MGGSPEVRSLRPAWATWRNPISTKHTKISWTWWWAPVISATQEAESQKSLEPGRQRLHTDIKIKAILKARRSPEKTVTSEMSAAHGMVQAKIDKWDLIKLHSFCMAKETVIRVN
ncbi:hypothetical protein AAY473_039615, partial [Plecturocebus cupreus]